MIKLKSLFRRGQGPSGSKTSSNTVNGVPIKGASSVSSLEGIGVNPKPPSKPIKSHHSSKDKLDQYSSNTKLSKDSLKHTQKERIHKPFKHPEPMPLIQQQQKHSLEHFQVQSSQHENK